MSVITNLILTFATGEDESSRIMNVNEYMYRGLRMNLVSVDYEKDMEQGKVWYGGTKFMEAILYLGAINHFDIDDFKKYLQTISWEFPELVQIIDKEQDDEKFRIVNL